MKASVESVKLDMSYRDYVELKTELLFLIDDVRDIATTFGGDFDELEFRAKYPVIFDLIGNLNITEKLTF